MDMKQLLEAQVGRELAASATYRALSQWARFKGFLGCAKWLMAASVEEAEHASKIQDYLTDFMDYPTATPAVPEVTASCETVGGCFASVLALERSVTAAVNELSEQALLASDTMTFEMLAWFRQEQIASIAEVGDIVRRTELAGAGGMLVFDEWVGEL